MYSRTASPRNSNLSLLKVEDKTLVVDEAEGPDWKLLSGLFRAQLIREFLTWSGVVPKVSGRK